ncbi:hypothetical protein TSUD_15820 [Trifolium subterraneum]|uniref:KIB1-4 beta-propeller domain-containing protein n=1 Tax=Trifolium subterraneum TaxID=3900 RepID=A0A2Z6NYW8_TRISU|nr:hypothetical protein TSUD_15820 [Trifolium subterraneum]
MASLSTVPYAILPSLFQETHLDEEDNTSEVHRSIFILFENKRYELSNLFKAHPGAWCVGSSQNFLVFLDNNGCPLLLNPSSNICFNLPHFPNSLIRRASVPSYSYYVEQLRKFFVAKAALMCSPSPSQYTLAIIYGSYPLCKIAFSSNRRASWVELFDANRCYCDIVFHNNNLYALTGDCSIEGWDFRQQVPRKILYADYPIMEKDKEEETKFPIDKFSSRLYLVISKGDFFLIERFIGNFVNAYGEVVYEGSNLSYEGNEVCPYRTKHFSVYKLVKTRWEKIKSLDGGVIFVGVNESKFVAKNSGYEGNLIYFSDDRWEEMNLDDSYGGHDWGVFNLEDSSIKFLAPYANKMDPPPIWMVPNSN